MPVTARSTPRVAYADYLALEAQSADRHEWYDGVVLAMAGGTPEHAFLAAACLRELGVALRGRSCLPYDSNLRLRSEATGLATYGDAVVVCGPVVAHPEDPDACTNPRLVVEVLSPTTEAYDRGQKFEHYRSFPSLRHYVLVSTGRARVEHYCRNDDGTWTLRACGPGEGTELAGLDVRLAVDALYDGVEAARGG